MKKRKQYVRQSKPNRDYDDPLYVAWRKAILKRDKNKCKWPGCKRKTKLEVHHIQRWANAPWLRYAETNGITLCSTHHKSIYGREQFFEEFFFSLIHNINIQQKIYDIKHGRHKPKQ